MALDKVKPLKIETTVDGDQNDPFPTEVNPTADYLAAKGIAFNDTDTKFIDTDGSGNIEFQDAVQTTPITLTGLTLAPNFFFVENVAIQSTASKTAINALTLTITTTLPAGKYYIAYNCQWTNSGSSSATNINCYFTVSGSETDVSVFTAKPSVATSYDQLSSWKVVTLGAQVANSVVLKLDFFAGATTASVKECRILFYRIQ